MSDPVTQNGNGKHPSRSDLLTYRMVVGFLGLAVLGALSGGIMLAWSGRDIPPFVQTLGATAIGVLGGLLAPTPRVS